MQPEIRQRFGINKFDVKGLYRAVERLGENRETVIAAFRNNILEEYGPEVTDVIFDWTSLVYFGYKQIWLCEDIQSMTILKSAK